MIAGLILIFMAGMILGGIITALLILHAERKMLSREQCSGNRSVG